MEWCEGAETISLYQRTGGFEREFGVDCGALRGSATI